jgi:hypothetical protein
VIVCWSSGERVVNRLPTPTLKHGMETGPGHRCERVNLLPQAALRRAVIAYVILTAPAVWRRLRRLDKSFALASCS